MKPESLHPESILVSSGRPTEPGEPLNPAVTFASNYLAGGDLGYSRAGNPVWQALEETLGALESGQATTFASGMAATAAIAELVPANGTVLAPTSCYFATTNLLSRTVAKIGAKLELVDITKLADWSTAAATADLIWLEYPTNPILATPDIEKIAKSTTGIVVVDSTLATPLRINPLTLGASVVMHSATKLISGHSDLILGAAITNVDNIHAKLRQIRELHGGIPGPMEAWLALRGLRSLAVRLDRAEANANEIATWLTNSGITSQVHYPRFGNIVSAEIKYPIVEIERRLAASKLIIRATSLGGVETTWERRRAWPSESTNVPENLIRISVGIENIADLITDLTQALT